MRNYCNIVAIYIVLPYHVQAIDHVMAGVEEILGHFGHNQVREKIQVFDSKYLRKIFERYPEARDEQILHTFKRLQFKWVDSLILSLENTIHIDNYCVD